MKCHLCKEHEILLDSEVVEQRVFPGTEADGGVDAMSLSSHVVAVDESRAGGGRVITCGHSCH